MKISHHTPSLSFKKSCILIVIFMAISTLLLWNLFMNNEDNFAGYAKKFPEWFSVTLFGGCFALVLCLIFNEKQELTSSASKYALYLLYFILSFLNAVQYTTINTFAFYYGFYHCNAVSQTIYNVHYNTPFNELTSGIYGHYALFFKPLTTIFGASPVSIAVTMGIIGFLTSMLSCLTIHLLIKSNTVRVLSAVSLVFFTNVILMVYWQTMPLRWFFPAIILFMATLYEKKQVNFNNIKHCLFVFFVCSLAILWETETGLFVSIVWSCFCSLRCIQEKGTTLKKFLKLLLIHLSAIFCEIIVAMGIMNIYNLCVGGRIEKKSFFFPLYTDFTGILQTQLKFGNMYYVYIIIVFMCCLLWAIRKIFYCKGKETQKFMVCSTAAISLMGFAMLTFYMNRTIAGVSCVYVQVILCISVLADAFIKPLRTLFCERKGSTYNVIKIVVGMVSISVLTIIVVLSSYTLPKVEERFKRGDYDVSSLSAFSKEIEATVPKNTYAIGVGTADIYGMLGWDAQYHMRDFADLPSGGKGDEIVDTVKSDIEQRQDVFVGTGEYPLLSSDFELIKEFTFNGKTYGYFHRDGIK